MKILFIFIIRILLVINASSAQSSQQYFAPGNSSWLGSTGPSSTPNSKHYLPIIYVVLGIHGTPHIRAIVDIHDDCPSPLHKEDMSKNIAEVESLDTLALGNPINENKMPYKFPVRVCELKVEEGTIHRKLLEEGTLSMSWKNRSYTVPRVKSNPTRFMFTADTGLRLKPSNLGLGNIANGEAPCNSSTVYGLHQCLVNFTKDDLIQEQTGSFQGLDEWYLKDLADDASSRNIDVIVHLGDYLYRQGPCPLNNTDFLDNETKNCSAVNVPEHVLTEEIMPGTVMNFIPGEYGDNWWGWWADFFFPMLNLLKEAPIIAVRGNHEVCDRGGFGYFMFLSPVEIEDYCLDKFTPYSIKFENEQFLVMDNSIIKELNGGVDHFVPGPCPGKPDSGLIVPLQQTRYNDTTDYDIQDHLELFTQHFKQIEKLSFEADTNFYIGHRPLLGIGCNNNKVVSLDWTLQQSLGPSTLNRISAIFSGHMHWLQVIEFEDNKLPPNIIVGNGGTKMIKNYINQSSIPYIDYHIDNSNFKIAARVNKGLTLSQFGYGIMERSEAGTYEVTFNVWDVKEGKTRPLDYSVLIPKSPQKSSTKTPPKAGSRNKLNWIVLVFIVLAGSVGAVSLQKWLLLKERRRTYEPLYEMESVKHNEN